MELSLIEARVLGSLMEKARTTPEVYPLTLNSLVTACNQKTSREPVTDYDEEEVMEALDQLREKKLVMRVDMAGSRTAKYRENLSELWELGRGEYALLCTLFLRGAQTPGQLRQRSERLHAFANLPQVTDCLKAMQERDEEPHCLVRALERRTGTKEIRYIHTLSPFEEEAEAEADLSALSEPAQSVPDAGRTARLEERVEALEKRLAELEQTLNELTT